MVVIDGNMVGYLGVTDLISSRIGNTISIYYGILKECYGHKFGKMIIDLVKESISLDCNIDYVIAAVDNENIYSKRVVEESDFYLEGDYGEESLFFYDNKSKTRV